MENRANLGFAKGNNSGIRSAEGELVLILNPDTVVHEGALGRWVEFADRHSEAGAFGCRVVNPDGSFQQSARPFPTPRRYWIACLYLRSLGRVSKAFIADLYPGWQGTSERQIDWQSGCAVMVRGDLLRRIGGFDERFFYHFEEVDLCKRVWDAGRPILYCPDAVITHLGGQSVGRFPIRFAIETYRNRYRYFYKHFGMTGVERCRRAARTGIALRRLGYGLLEKIRPTEALRNRLEMYRTIARWNRGLNPRQFIEQGREPKLGYEPLAPAPDMRGGVPSGIDPNS